MKIISAYIQPEKLNDVKQALSEAQVFKMSVTNALGCGQQKGYHETYRGVDMEVNLLKKIRLEIAVNEDFVDSTVQAIIDGARTESIGDGAGVNQPSMVGAVNQPENPLCLMTPEYQWPLFFIVRSCVSKSTRTMPNRLLNPNPHSKLSISVHR